MSENLYLIWKNLFLKYSNDKNKCKLFFDEILKKYNSKKKYYHNLEHIKSMIDFAQNIEGRVSNFDILRFTIWYHDVIYNPLKGNNEEKSADFAEKHLSETKLSENDIREIKHLIIRTKNHFIREENESLELQYMLDLDLMILGAKPDKYQEYIKKVRKEYSFYPQKIFNKGRKKVLNEFLNTEFIYRTDYFRELFEKQARENIKNEFNLNYS